ncbi:MAG: BON domain-containing protein [Vicinamibacterales bacterium]
MRRMTKTVALTAVVAALALAPACSDRAESRTGQAARDAANAAEQAGDAVSEAARNAGAAVMDGGRAAGAAMETMDVKAALVAEPRLHAGDINVDTDHETKTVTLKGRVGTEMEKTLAEDIAAKHASGYRVINALIVAAP